MKEYQTFTMRFKGTLSDIQMKHSSRVMEQEAQCHHCYHLFHGLQKHLRDSFSGDLFPINGCSEKIQD